MTTATTKHEDARGVYFWTRYQVTAIYQVVMQRRIGSASIRYLVSTGKSIKYTARNLQDAVNEATRRQRYIDRIQGELRQ